jgi:DNA-binding CsgD family transcriptional regulator
MTGLQDVGGLKSDLQDLVAELRVATDLRPASKLLRTSASMIAMTHVAVVTDVSHPDAPTDEAGESLVELLGWPQAFVDEWLQRNYSARSRAMVRARMEHLPFAWSPDEVAKDAGAIALQRLGITAWIMAPVRLPRGRFGVVAWLGPIDSTLAVQLADDLGPEFLLLAHYYLDLMRRGAETPAVHEDLARLSPRELECLTLVAKGASDQATGAQLGLATRTVRFHLSNAAEKLGAQSRSHAVALATQLGILGSVF